MIIGVIIDLPYGPGNKLYYYNIDEEIYPYPKIGMRVLAPFGTLNKSKIGIISNIVANDEIIDRSKLKNIVKLIDIVPYYTSEQIELSNWCATRFITTPYCVLKSMSNVEFNMLKYQYLILTNLKNFSDIPADLINHISSGSSIDVLLKENINYYRIIQLALQDKIFKLDFKANRSNIKYRLNNKFSREEIKIKLKNAPKQYEAYEYFRKFNCNKSFEIDKKYNSIIKALLRKNIVHECEEFIVQNDYINKVTYTTEQKYAINTINNALLHAKYRGFLLHGITGSGKTEVYIATTQKAISMNKQVLILLPEIALTAQLVNRFREVFGEIIYVVHSKISELEKTRIFNLVKSGKPIIIIGVRSSVFAPFVNLGLIIVDEAHDSSYKQSEPEPRYNARIVAEKRSKLFNCVYLAGSATPLIETYFRAEQGNLSLLSMTKRVNNTLPIINVIDLKIARFTNNSKIFSEPLYEALKKTYTKNEQSIILLNKKGYASFLMCRECGYVIKCNKCDIPFTVYRSKNLLRCNYCNDIKNLLNYCPRCHSSQLVTRGMGTERITEEFSELFPNLKFDRFDSEAIRYKNSVNTILNKFKNRKTNTLIGTQLVAKSLDFPNVTTVGVINSDLLLYFPDFHSSERTFQLLTQVSGRAGRGNKKGKVYIQTYSPNHPAIQYAVHHDYIGFYRHELSMRKMMGYPPYYHILRILITDKNRNVAKNAIEEIHELLKLTNDIMILGPSQAPIVKIKNRYRFHMIVKSKSIIDLLNIGKNVREYKFNKKIYRELRVIVDINPENML